MIYDCCIVGAGPAGMLLALRLARQGLRVILLEAQQHFERDFRGNTLNPAALELLETLGVLDQVLALRHAKMRRFQVETADGAVTFADFTCLPTEHRYVAMLPQSAFLELLAQHVRQHANATLIMGASVRGLLTEDEQVCGVRYRTAQGEAEVRATLTVGADGRFSQVRKHAGLAIVPSNAPIDVLWLRLPRQASDPSEAGALFRFGRGALLALMDHGDSWQIGYIMRKQGYHDLRTHGFPAFQQTLMALLPEMRDRVQCLQGWADCALLPVESSRVERWFRPGLLLIGDAAHVMSPVGGVGITCALQDAWAAADLLGPALQSGNLTQHDLQAVQRRREWPTRLVQAGQHFLHRKVVDGALAGDQPFSLALWMRLALRTPLLRQIPARLIAFGGLSRG